MTEYRRKKDSEVWHWCTNCPEYPGGEAIVTRHTRPEYGKLCPTCEVKRQAGDCKGDSFFSVRK